MRRIGLLADTHGYLDPTLWDYFDDRDEIWHAGDFGCGVAELLRQRKPLRGVYGNIDDGVVRADYPEHLRFRCEQVDVWMTHIGGQPGRYAKGIRSQLINNPPTLFICGHSHLLQVGRDSAVGKVLFLNPGAAGHQGFHAMRTALRFEIEGCEIRHMQVIELGPRGRQQHKEKNETNSAHENL